jgi:hypothetical protein
MTQLTRLTTRSISCHAVARGRSSKHPRSVMLRPPTVHRTASRISRADRTAAAPERGRRSVRPDGCRGPLRRPSRSLLKLASTPSPGAAARSGHPARRCFRRDRLRRFVGRARHRRGQRVESEEPSIWRYKAACNPVSVPRRRVRTG